MTTPSPHFATKSTSVVSLSDRIRLRPYTNGNNDGLTRLRTCSFESGCQSRRRVGTCSRGETATFSSFLREAGIALSDLTTSPRYRPTAPVSSKISALCRSSSMQILTVCSVRLLPSAARASAFHFDTILSSNIYIQFSYSRVDRGRAPYLEMPVLLVRPLVEEVQHREFPKGC